MIVCRLCGSGPCISTVAEGDVCPWAQTCEGKKTYAPDPRPAAKPKKGAK